MSDSGPKILDLTYLAEAADGDLEFINEILADYLVEMAQYLLQLDEQLKNPEMSTLIRAAHTIKGASANVGAARVREIAAKLETQAKKGSVEGGESLIRILHQEIDRVKELIEREGVDSLLEATG